MGEILWTIAVLKGRFVSNDRLRLAFQSCLFCFFFPSLYSDYKIQVKLLGEPS